MKRKISFFIFSAVFSAMTLLLSCVVSPSPVFAADPAQSPQQRACEGAGGTWGKEKDASGHETGAEKCLSDTAKGPTVQSTIKDVIDLLLFLVGIIAVIVIVVSGFRFVTSNGDSQQVSKAKNAIIYAVIGIVVAVMAYAIVNFILDNV